ncbi:hypothetical protein A3B19_02490 [Candidatus Giovannonibacteria bacterium RIFCSPLOWO2_01_FULL_46_32]|uniref:DUF4919 domain-containing protein n=1 Tax=Candidatus Giovannonibacteria bacterium RIFCSPLOWO2_01_FULL_46_32 TaxID=1798353 RepID=A0A1F5XID4_9BACT|nr:MAG: hypothetical protein A3B19_02490 [Candidatus Giovannonibacteria bacterium RIFCSPLOWO2_01_FULL_46_32]
MKTISGFTAVLCLLVLFAIPVFAQQESDSPYDIINGRHQDFGDFEELASGPMPWVRDRTFVPDYRAMHLEQVKRYESFLAKYPESPLKAEALFMLAMLYLGVEGQDVHMFRQRLFVCQGVALEQRNQQKLDICQMQFMLSIASAGGAADPTYQRLGRQVLKGLVEKYPHARRYIMIKPGAGGFRFDEEEIGAIALYVLAQGMIPGDRLSYYQTIIQEFKIRPELRREMQNRLGIQ